VNYPLAAITAKFLPATSYLGSRVRVISQRGVVTYLFDYRLSGHEVFNKAVGSYLDWIKSVDKEKHGSEEGWGSLDDFLVGQDTEGHYIYVRKPKYDY
jgi:hypothetical protein